MNNPIKLSFQQELDIQLAYATECPDGLDRDSACYVVYHLVKGEEVPADKWLARTCGQPRCTNPAHMVLVDRSTDP